ncbi:MAG TPA: hypothetical protein VKV40_15850 [Ktedonobacteraceae bacterium]|nr:hypothetical protein [Ktedonobacteraceae bacterium]
MSTLEETTIEENIYASVVNAYLDSERTLIVKLTHPLILPVATSSVTLTDTTTGEIIPVANVGLPQTAPIVVSGNFPHAAGESALLTAVGIETDLVEVILERAPDGTHNLEIAFDGYMHGTARISECKQMIQSLHTEGIGVSMDVVYNHTFSWYYSDFNKIVPEYFYRTDDAGNYTDGSGTGNELASERSMVQKFILDSLEYWTREYHVDGFRFDLKALLGIETIKKAQEMLYAINPHVLLYGEPWTGDTSGLPHSEQLTKGRQKGLGVAVFNDTLRGLLCGSVLGQASRWVVVPPLSCMILYQG